MKYGDRKSLATALEQVLEAYAKIPDDERRPPSVNGNEKPVPAPPAGGAVLTIYDRPLGYADGQYRLPEGSDLGDLRTHAPDGQRSSLWLTRQECQSLIPQSARKGESHVVPSALAKRICLYGLWPQTLWVVEHTWQPDSVRECELRTTVVDVSPTLLRLRIHGAVVLAANARLKIYPTGKHGKDVQNRYDARLEGILVYDRPREKIVQWDMVALGDYTGAMFTTRLKDGRPIGDDQWREATKNAPAPLGFSFELDTSAYEAPPEYRRPRSFVHAYIFRDREPFYWDPEKWEADWRSRSSRSQ